jgi:hypothetical protein
LKIIRIAVDLEFPPGKIPTWTTEYVNSTRLVCTKGTSNKEYIVRVYRYPDGKFAVVGWNGRVGGTLIPHLKYIGDDVGIATSHYGILIGSKLTKGYHEHEDDQRAPGKKSTIHSLEELMTGIGETKNIKDIHSLEELITGIGETKNIKEKSKEKNKLVPSSKPFSSLKPVRSPIKPKEKEVFDISEMEVPESEKEYLELLSQKENNNYKASRLL